MDAKDVINRAKNLQEFEVQLPVPPTFTLNGVIPFDMEIVGSIMKAKVWAVDFNEAVARFDKYLSENTDF